MFYDFLIKDKSRFKRSARWVSTGTTPSKGSKVTQEVEVEPNMEAGANPGDNTTTLVHQPTEGTQDNGRQTREKDFTNTTSYTSFLTRIALWWQARHDRFQNYLSIEKRVAAQHHALAQQVDDTHLDLYTEYNALKDQDTKTQQTLKDFREKLKDAEKSVTEFERTVQQSRDVKELGHFLVGLGSACFLIGFVLAVSSSRIKRQSSTYYSSFSESIRAHVRETTSGTLVMFGLVVYLLCSGLGLFF